MGDGSIAAWKNYGGGKTWPAPQGWDRPDQWHGPPDPVLDTGPYTLEILDDSSAAAASIRMTSSAGPANRRPDLTRQISLHAGGGGVSLHLEMTNVSDQERTWSIWDVVQVDATQPRTPNGQRDRTANRLGSTSLPIPESRYSTGATTSCSAKMTTPNGRAEVRP